MSQRQKDLAKAGEYPLQDMNLAKLYANETLRSTLISFMLTDISMSSQQQGSLHMPDLSSRFMQQEEGQQSMWEDQERYAKGLWLKGLGDVQALGSRHSPKRCPRPRLRRFLLWL